MFEVAECQTTELLLDSGSSPSSPAVDSVTVSSPSPPHCTMRTPPTLLLALATPLLAQETTAPCKVMELEELPDK